jgi:hypothetical protein
MPAMPIGLHCSHHTVHQAPSFAAGGLGGAAPVALALRHVATCCRKWCVFRVLVFGCLDLWCKDPAPTLLNGGALMDWICQ